MQDLPESACAAIRAEFPESAEAYIAGYPALIADLCDLWRLKGLEPLAGGLDINQVYRAQTPDGPRILKVGHPHPEQVTEMRMLAVIDRFAMVNLISSDPRGAILLEEITPGTQLRQFINDPEAISAALPLLKVIPTPTADLPSEALASFPTYEHWFMSATEGYKPRGIPFDETVILAGALFCELSGSPCLLHGDLHHENILLEIQDNNERRWRVIDPKGVIGPAVMECGRFLHNFLKDQEEARDYVNILLNRYALAEEVIGYTPVELARVTLIDATLCTCWWLSAKSELDENGLEALKVAEATFKAYEAIFIGQ